VPWTRHSWPRLARLGVQPLPSELGLALLDAAQRVDAALVVPVRLDLAAVRAQARAGASGPAAGRAGPGSRPGIPGGTGGSLATRLAQADPAKWEQLTLDLVTAQVAAVLGHCLGPPTIDPGRAFKELGFDSLSAVELPQPAGPGDRAQAAGHADLRPPTRPRRSRGSWSS